MATEVFNRIGEAEIYSKNENRGFKKYNQDVEEIDFEKITKKDIKPISEAKKEFIDNLEDESLNIDTCASLNKDWN